MSDPSPVRVLVTGAGGPAGVAVLRSLARRPDVRPMAADMDRYATGLYPVDAGAHFPGVDMPSLALDLALGRDLPDPVPFAEVAVVRYLEDVFLAPADVLTAPVVDGVGR